jgi:hypothetical protein
MRMRSVAESHRNSASLPVGSSQEMKLWRIDSVILQTGKTKIIVPRFGQVPGEPGDALVMTTHSCDIDELILKIARLPRSCMVGATS